MGNFLVKMCKFDTFVLYAHYASALTYFFYFRAFTSALA